MPTKIDIIRKVLAALNEEKNQLIDKMHAVDVTIEAMNDKLAALYEEQDGESK